MNPSGRYSRVYWEIIDDPKFLSVYDDDRALATWLRLLIVADMAYPATPPVPVGTQRRALEVLESSGIIELVGSSRFRIVGLAAERDRRSAPGRAGAEARWSGRSAEAMRPHSVGTAPLPDVALPVKKSKEEQSRAEEEKVEDASDDHLDAYYRLTGSFPSRKVLPWLNELADVHGSEEVSRALALEAESEEDRRTLLSRTQSRLERDAHQRRRAAEKVAAERAIEERRRIEEMPEEVRAANVARLRDMIGSTLSGRENR